MGATLPPNGSLTTEGSHAKKSSVVSNSAWQYRAETPALSGYVTDVEDGASVPELEASLQDIGEYQRRLRANASRSLLLVFHGLDASGKDSMIRTLATYMDPSAFHAWSFSRPHGSEERHDFLWRVTPRLPEYGEVVASNRSHHEAAIAERAWPVRPVTTNAPHGPSWPGSWQNGYRNWRPSIPLPIPLC